MDVVDQCVEVEDDGLQHLPRAEGEQLANQVLGAGGRVADDLDFFPRRRAHRRVEQQQLAGAEHGGEDIVEVVSDTRRELADGFHPLRLQQLIFQAAPLALHARLREHAGHGRREALQPVLHEVVGGAGFHRGHRGVFAHAARHHDERDAGRVLFQEGERRQRVESRHDVVAQHDVPRLPLERGAHARGGIHPLVQRREPPGPQRAQYQLRVGGGVLHDQDAERAHAGGRLSSSQ